jgi:GNAT superfamily N-acetyltransferase
VDIRPLDASTWSRLETFFRTGGDPKWCWCQWWRMRSRDFGAAKVPELRQRLRDQAEPASEPPDAGATAPPAPGLVAIDDDRAIGWVSLGPRDTFERIERSRVIPRVDDRPAWSIVCFAVAPDRRGEGVAKRLLDAAVEYAAAHGARLLEAYPVDAAGRLPASAEAAFTGTRALFEQAGFAVVAPTGSRSAGVPRVVMQRELAGPRA